MKFRGGMEHGADQLFSRASLLEQQGERREAIVLLQSGLGICPADAERWYQLAYLLRTEGRYEESLAAYGRALACGVSRSEEVHLNRSVIYADHLRDEVAAERELQAALALAPDYLPALLNLGNLYEDQGRRKPALDAYSKAVAVGGANVNRGSAYAELHFEALARSIRLCWPDRLDDPSLQRLQQAAAEPLRASARASLLFTLGHALDRLGAYGEAFTAFARANRWLLRESGRTYDRSSVQQQVAQLHEPFTEPERFQYEGVERPQIVFILGMWRSGSTLLEQVLGSHSEVLPCGEFDFLPRLTQGRPARFPASMILPEPERDIALRMEYRSAVLRLFPTAAEHRYVTDKRQDNFMRVGLIKRIFPDAKILHTVRDPVDTCLSVYMQHLNLHTAGYSADLADIGHFYGQYRRVMAHWKALYSDSIFDFDYDAFVRDPRPNLQGLLGFLGLDYDERCLSFHELGNSVKTASHWQVREPLNTGGSGRWRHYEPHLQPLFRELDASGVTRVT